MACSQVFIFYKIVEKYSISISSFFASSVSTQACIQMAEPGDLVLVYFAGHAFLNESTGDGYLALATTRYQQPETGIHLFSLAQQAMGRSRASTILFMLDCFQSGPAWGPRRS